MSRISSASQESKDQSQTKASRKQDKLIRTHQPTRMNCNGYKGAPAYSKKWIEDENYYDKADRQHEMLKNHRARNYVADLDLPTVRREAVPNGDGYSRGYSDGTVRWTPYNYHPGKDEGKGVREYIYGKPPLEDRVLELKYHYNISPAWNHDIHHPGQDAKGDRRRQKEHSQGHREKGSGRPNEKSRRKRPRY
jgi:hypothetical protein